jgi:RNA polymerase sigma-70 factor (ECF subfamily)
MSGIVVSKTPGSSGASFSPQTWRERIDAARRGLPDQLGGLLDLYRNYLTLLARTQVDRKLRARISPSDIVQDTMLAAGRDFPQFRGSSERQFLAWLRQILLHAMQHAVETHVKAQRRDVRCEISLDQAAACLDQSAAQLVDALADPGPTPSAPAHRREAAVALADRLATMKPQYRDVIVLRNLQGLPFDAVAEHMDRTPGAARMLWLRAMEKLREIYREPGCLPGQATSDGE